MNIIGQQSEATFQALYYQLLAQYSNLAQNYHHQAQENTRLFLQLEQLLRERVSLANQDVKTQTSLPLTPLRENSQIIPIKRQTDQKQIQKSKMMQQQHLNLRDYPCPYEFCYSVYRSSISMNLHIKLKHNGGTKKQREAAARLLIQAHQRGLQPPKIALNLPPNFLRDYKKKYQYAKKYNM